MSKALKNKTKLNDVVDVKADFGAVGDGVTDDTTAIVAAFASIATNGGSLYFPQGQYKVPNGIDFHLAAAESANSYLIYGAGRKESVIVTTNASVSLDLGGRNRVILKDIGIKDNGTTSVVGIARYRDTTIGSDGGGNNHTYQNLYMEGMWSAAALYSIASEVNDHYTVDIHQNGNGACYFTAATNVLSVTAHGSITGGSNTVNNFYGGEMIGAAGTTGGAVYCASGIADQLNFYGTYLVGWTGGYNVKLGNAVGDSLQGNKVFDGCRFEGTADAFNVTATQVQFLNVQRCTFGQITGIAFNWTNTPASTGLEDSIIKDNMFGANSAFIIPVITSSYVKINDTTVYHGTTLTVNGHIASSTIEASNLTLGGSCYVYASTIIQNDGFNGIYRIKYGPNSVTSAGNNSGSVVVNNPFGKYPVGALNGSVVTMGSYLNPAGLGLTAFGEGADYPMFFESFTGEWRPMVTLSGTPTAGNASGVKGTVCYDASYIYVCTASGTAGTLNAGATTGSITLNSTTLTVNSATGLSAGTYITIVGISGLRLVTDVSGTTITLASAANATVVAAAVAYAVPIWRRVAIATW